MSYKKAANILPEDLLEKVQKYVDGEYIYIPRITENKKAWGTKTSVRKDLKIRNRQIYKDYLNGEGLTELSQKYFLSTKSIQRIIGQQKKDKIE